jgi:hypothetical protein
MPHNVELEHALKDKGGCLDFGSSDNLSNDIVKNLALWQRIQQCSLISCLQVASYSETRCL